MTDQDANMTEPIEQQSRSFLHLRILVLILGESAHAKWWRTQFLTDAGLRFLDRLYPRTSCAAGIRAASVAARDIHDSSIGRGRVYHLFRLPDQLEGHLHALATEGYLDQIFAELRPSLDDHEALLGRFDSLSSDQPEVEAGPQRVGSIRDLKRGNILGKWAGAYLHAFRGDYQVFPYVEAAGIF